MAVVAPDDRGSLHARSADETVEIASYLEAAEHIRAARETGADAVHPGYGFLAESGDFAAAVDGAGLDLGRPACGRSPPRRRQAGGEADRARGGRAGRAGRHGRARSACRCSSRLPPGAAAGACASSATESELDEALAAAEREAEAAFGDGTVFLRALPRAAAARRDPAARGRTRHGARARRARLLDAAAAPEGARGVALARARPATLRAAMSDAAVAFARAIGYRSAGTAEFMVDGRRVLLPRAERPHPGRASRHGARDRRRPRRRAAARGGRGSDSRSTQSRRGHRACGRGAALRRGSAQLPPPGRARRAAAAPGGVRVDAGVEEGDEIGIAYDPMIAKLIAHGPTRDEALARLADALAETEVGGVTTNLPFLRWLVAHPVLRAGEATTAFLTEHPPLSPPPLRLPAPALARPVAAQPAPRPRRAGAGRRRRRPPGTGGGRREHADRADARHRHRVHVAAGDRVAARQPTRRARSDEDGDADRGALRRGREGGARRGRRPRRRRRPARRAGGLTSRPTVAGSGRATLRPDVEERRQRHGEERAARTSVHGRRSSASPPWRRRSTKSSTRSTRRR